MFIVFINKLTLNKTAKQFENKHVWEDVEHKRIYGFLNKLLSLNQNPSKSILIFSSVAKEHLRMQVLSYYSSVLILDVCNC